MLPVYFELDPGERFTDRFGGDTPHTVELLCVNTRTEPLYQHGIWFDVFRDAQIDLLIDEKPLRIACAPYQLPTAFAGLVIEADLVSKCAGGLHTIPLKKAVRFAALCEGRPWMAEHFHLPMPDGRWRASNYMHTWNGFVHVVEYQDPPAVYYHRGEDLGAYPDRHPLLSGLAGTLVAQPPEQGDGDSNEIRVEGEELGVYYAHANAPTVNRSLHLGDAVTPETRLALTGDTWAGRKVSDPHLHMGFYRAGARVVSGAVNAYADYVRAYRAQFPDELLPVAGGYRFARVGETLELTAERSIACADSGEIAYRWRLCDGTEQEGVRACCRYEQAGVYTEILLMSDRCGRCAADTVMVYVSDGVCPILPFATINLFPAREIRAGQSVEMLVCTSRLEDAVIDFGDGSRLPLTARNALRHAWGEPGVYTVTVSGTGEGCCGIFRCVVPVMA